MVTKYELTGKVFGRYTVLSYLGNRKWLCQCNCGNTNQVRTPDLISGKTKGCKLCSNRLPDGVTGFNNLYSKYKIRAEKFNREFSLTKGDFKTITSSLCHYCGIVPSSVSSSNRDFAKEQSTYLYNGIDRRDSSLGYTLNNSLPCCEFCNKAKRDLPYDIFINHLKRITEYVNTNFS